MYHKACFSNLAITQQADLQGDQIGIRVIPTTSRWWLIIQRSHGCLYCLRRQKRPAAGQPPVPGCLSYGTDKNPVPNESKKLSNNRHPLEYAPPDVDANNFSAKLVHISSSLVKNLGHDHGSWKLLMVFSSSFFVKCEQLFWYICLVVLTNREAIGETVDRYFV